MGIQAAFRGLEIDTIGYIGTQKESLIGVERRNRVVELMEKKVRSRARHSRTGSRADPRVKEQGSGTKRAGGGT